MTDSTGLNFKVQCFLHCITHAPTRVLCHSCICSSPTPLRDPNVTRFYSAVTRKTQELYRRIRGHRSVDHFNRNSLWHRERQPPTLCLPHTQTSANHTQQSSDIMADMTAKQEQLSSSYRPHHRIVTQQCVCERRSVCVCCMRVWVSTASV